MILDELEIIHLSITVGKHCCSRKVEDAVESSLLITALCIAITSAPGPTGK